MEILQCLWCFTGYVNCNTEFQAAWQLGLHGNEITEPS